MSRNSRISDETLLGYLLIALPEAEQWRIETLAISDSVLRQRIEDLRDLLDPIRELSGPVEPRAELTASTMALIEQAVQSDSLRSNQSARMSQPLFESDRATRLAWIDSFVALAAGMVILSILLPSVWNSRESSRKNFCVANLREIGHALTLYAQGNANRKIPEIEVNGTLCFAGVYAIRLKEAGLLESPKFIWCPAGESFDVDQAIPSRNAFLGASFRQQQNLKNTAGGNYSYNLGNWVNGVYETASLNNGRSQFAVIGDSLLPVASEEGTGAVHGGNSSNVLFDDGRIQSVRVHQKNVASMLDNPYLNLEMQQAVGRGLDDTCLGPSFQNPLKPLSVSFLPN